MIYDMETPPASKEEIEQAKQDARRYLWVRTKRAIYAAVVFFLSCASVVPFLYGHPLHTYWESFGKYLLLVSMGVLIPFVALAGSAINAWFFVREVEKTEE